MAYFAASCDDLETITKFARSLDADYPMLADPEKAAAGAYGVVGSLRPWPQRWTFYIGKDGKILYIDKDVKTGTAGADLADRLEQLAIAKKKQGCASGIERAGSALFTLTIENTSVEAVRITALMDDNALSAGCLALIGTTLAVGETKSCTYTVTHSEAGSYPNTAEVTVADNEGNSASDDDTETVSVRDVLPTVTLDKTGEATINEGGHTATYTLTITNTSLVDAVTVTALSDDQFGDLLAEAEAAKGGNPIVLAVGGSFSFSIDRALDLNAGETHDNTATVVWAFKPYSTGRKLPYFTSSGKQNSHPMAYRVTILPQNPSREGFLSVSRLQICFVATLE